ncbi:MAG: aminopeptidase [Anaerolineaceae bacterium]
MNDPRVEKLADMLVNYSIGIKPGDKAFIEGNHLAKPLIAEIYKKVFQSGGYPYMDISMAGWEEIFYKYASDDQIKYIHEPIKILYETYDANFYIQSDANTSYLSNVDPSRIVLHKQARHEIRSRFYERAARGELRWVYTLYPTEGHAQNAGMSIDEYSDFVFKACMPDLDDPVGYWKKVSAYQQKVISWLKGKKNVHVTGPDTDLSLSIEGRLFINCDCHLNVPDGEIFCGPVENKINGHVYFSYPAIYLGHEVTGVRLWFEEGKVVKATADKNQDYLEAMLDTDEGSRHVGEFAIGTNEGITKFTGEILYDEKIGGSFHMALGDSYPESGGLNKSAIHWDLICDLRNGGEITVDGVTLHKNGKFVVDL